MASSIPGVKRYLFETALPSLYSPPTSISYGPFGTEQGDDSIYVGNSEAQVSMPRMGAMRTYDESADLELVIDCVRYGGPEVQVAATEAAFSMLSSFRDYFKTQGNETLGGKCSYARVTGYTLDEGNGDDVEAGRSAQIIVTLHVEGLRQ